MRLDCDETAPGPLAIVVVGPAIVAYCGGPDSARASAPELRRYPYLTDVVGGSATVNWGTDRTVRPRR
jgi:hypothetical protein